MAKQNNPCDGYQEPLTHEVSVKLKAKFTPKLHMPLIILVWY